MGSLEKSQDELIVLVTGFGVSHTPAARHSQGPNWPVFADSFPLDSPSRATSHGIPAGTLLHLYRPIFPSSTPKHPLRFAKLLICLPCASLFTQSPFVSRTALCAPCYPSCGSQSSVASLALTLCSTLAWPPPGPNTSSNPSATGTITASSTSTLLCLTKIQTATTGLGRVCQASW